MNDQNTKKLNLDDFQKQYDKVVEVKIDTEKFDSTMCEYTSVEDINDKMISYLEKEVRGSYEYKNYINYLKNELDLNKCDIMPDLDINTNPVSLEFHHYPITLYEIVAVVSTEMLSNLDDGESVSSFDIAERVMKEHYENNIGLVPLTSTLHQMAHNKAITIPHNVINGNYFRFMQKYKDYISDDIMDRITENINRSTDENCINENKQKLEKKIMQYNIDYHDNDECDIDDFDFGDNDDKDWSELSTDK